MLFKNITPNQIYNMLCYEFRRIEFLYQSSKTPVTKEANIDLQLMEEMKAIWKFEIKPRLQQRRNQEVNQVIDNLKELIAVIQDNSLRARLEDAVTIIEYGYQKMEQSFEEDEKIDIIIL